MKVFKIILLTLLLSTSFIYSQKTNETNKYETIVYSDWQNSGSGYWSTNDKYYTYNDFDFLISRSKETFGGYYYYDFWLFSQSYYWDGNEATYTSTNIKDITVIVDGNVVKQEFSDIGITFNKMYNAITLRVKSSKVKPNIIITWKSMSAK